MQSHILSIEEGSMTNLPVLLSSAKHLSQYKSLSQHVSHTELCRLETVVQFSQEPHTW